ncbi:MAG: helix-turn-helix transcriptional regulator [Halanaeroarchaeum sp.]
MERRTIDGVVAALVGLVLVAGLAATWQAWQSYQRVSSGMMGGMMTTSMMNTGPSPLWLLFGTVSVAAIVAVGYLVVRENVAGSRPANMGRLATGNTSPGTTASESTREANSMSDTANTESASGNADSRAGEQAAEPERSSSRPAILDVLPEDERRILEPIVQSPGLTQIELRDRADFSKSKVSQTVSDLEKRGLVSRERQGRTYRVYPGGDLSAES